MRIDVESPITDIESILNQYTEKVQLYIIARVFAKKCGSRVTASYIATSIGKPLSKGDDDDEILGK